MATPASTSRGRKKQQKGQLCPRPTRRFFRLVLTDQAPKKDSCSSSEVVVDVGSERKSEKSTDVLDDAEEREEDSSELAKELEDLDATGKRLRPTWTALRRPLVEP